MKSARFPYQDVREGQEEFIRRTYRALAKGNTLFACAPTGTGKTVSVIYPAIKALGEEKCDKVFYLTPKGTTAEAAKDLQARAYHIMQVMNGIHPTDANYRVDQDPDHYQKTM